MSLIERCYEKMSYLYSKYDEPSDSARASVPGNHERPTRRREGEDHNPVSSRAHQRSDLRSCETRSPTPTDYELRDPTQVYASHTRSERSAKTDRDLATKKKAYDQMEDELDKMQQSLKTENARLRKAESEKEEWKQKATERRKRLIKITAELNRVVGSAQGFRKDDDSELRTKAGHLRADIREIPSCHLKEPQELEISEPTYKLFEDRLQLSKSNFEKYLQSRSTRSELVQAFIWETLCVKIFGRFGWVPESTASAMIAMSEFLDKIPNATTIPEAKRTFHVWRATTTNTMVEALKLDHELVMQHTRERSERLTQSTIAELSDLLQLSKREELEERFREIFDASLELSETIDTQLASITWTSMGQKVPAQPDRRRIDSQPVKSHHSNHQVKLIVAPGLVRCGKSSGDNFDDEVVEILPPLSGHRV